MKTLLSLAALAAATLVAPVASAQNIAPLPSIGVSYIDLDLTDRAGRTKLNHRLANAARAVCGAPSSGDTLGKNQVLRCRSETYAAALAQRDAAFASANRAAPIAVAAR